MLIGLSGKLRTGKDTIASMVCNRYKFDRYALADELRIFCKKVFKAKTMIEYNEIYQYMQDIFMNCSFQGDRKELINRCFTHVIDDRKRFTYIDGDKNRDILQYFGELVRKYEPDFWIQALVSKMNFDNNNIITDIRLYRELQKLARYGFKMVRVSASKAVRTKILGSNVASQINHSTETELDKINTWDYHVFNNGDLSDLEIKALDMVKYFEDMLCKEL